jgi:hypothetical protein
LDPVSPPRISTGIAGLDNLLVGGLPRRGLYLLEGASGTGKTTFALQFLLAGVAANERALLVTLSETAGEVREFAETHGWSLDGIDIMDLNDLRAVVGDTGRQTVFHHADVEFTKLTNLIAQRIEKTKDPGKVCRHGADGRWRRSHHDRYRQLDRLRYIRWNCGGCRPADSESAFFSRAAKRHDFVGFRPAWSAWLCGRSNDSDELSRGHGDPAAIL